MQVIGGASIAEEGLAAETTLRQGKAKRVVWLLDSLVFNYSGPRREVQMPHHLYGSDLSGLVRYLLDRTTLSMSVAITRYLLDGNPPKDFVFNLDDLYGSVLPHSSVYSAEAVRQAFHSEWAVAELARRERAVHTPFDEDGVARAFAEHVVSLISRYPEVTFDIVLPPSSIAFYQFLRQHFPRRLAQHMFLRKLAYEQIPNFTNARLFDIQANADITENYGNFSDMLHYSPDVGRRILETIRNGNAATTAAAEMADRALIESIARVPTP
jgi:hypothetical protein